MGSSWFFSTLIDYMYILRLCSTWANFDRPSWVYSNTTSVSMQCDNVKPLLQHRVHHQISDFLHTNGTEARLWGHSQSAHIFLKDNCTTLSTNSSLLTPPDEPKLSPEKVVNFLEEEFSSLSVPLGGTSYCSNRMSCSSRTLFWLVPLLLHLLPPCVNTSVVRVPFTLPRIYSLFKLHSSTQCASGIDEVIAAANPITAEGPEEYAASNSHLGTTSDTYI